ncbi:hypothetical protein HNQ93_000331 [Hymenobacter luteus]|uniref:Outer membrane protein beta-barrel domain-containing protein n=2 Tax=Hymenobacter TaxID=89966 RepID=A0A7W9WAN9_9BACT|nr:MULTISPECIES: porin family protein [Hymenobacter]MBB4600189.1 hypothetical protein [Hymenobacter latericoloratus]MBB6057501.1 hypothetical protein [Hymenobacter luteus]
MIAKQHAPLLITAMLMAGAQFAQAQVTIGPRVGLNLATVSGDTEFDGFEADPKMILAPQVGVTLNAQFGNLALQPSLLFSQKGFKVEEEISGVEDGEVYSASVKGNMRLNYLEIPVNLVYNTSGEEGGFQIFAGPYVGIGLGGKAKTEVDFSGGGSSFNVSESTNVKFANQDDANSDQQFVRQPDFGANFGLGYKAGPFQVQAGYSLGLSNLIPDSADGSEPEAKLRNRVVQVSLNYFFGGK